MAQLDVNKIKKLEKGETVGAVATCFCGVVFIYFIALFALSLVQGNSVLQIILWSTTPALMVIGIALSAFCNLKYSKGIERLITEYVLQVFVENAPLMHPEKDDLTFYISHTKKSVQITVNGYKEKIVFDFSDFKMSALRQLSVLKIITDRLAATFCRMYNRGAEFKSVEYCHTNNGNKRKIKIISNGEPDKKIFKNYLKNR